jgi:hypothetical protein
LGRRARRREHEAHAAPRRQEAPPRADRPARKPSRSEIKDAEARAKLVPLREDERPRAVTVAAIVAGLLAIYEVIAYVAGQTINGKKPPVPQIAVFVILMAAAAWGAWRARYWAVLGIQALLAITIVFFSLALLRASRWTDVLIVIAVVAPAGTLFYFLVKSLARIQMPERRPR